MLSGNLGPPDFLYPSFFYYLVAAVYAAWYVISRPFESYASLAAFAESRYQSVAPFFYLSRGLSAVMGTLTVWWVFTICRRLFDETVALVAALFMALAFLHVRDSHFGTTDVPMTALVVLSVLFILQWQESGRSWHLAAAGVVGGLAASTKYNGFGVAVPFAVAALERLTRGGRAPSSVSALRRLPAAAAVFAVAFAAGFFGGSPYILFNWNRFVTDATTQGAALAAGHGLRLSRGWRYHAVLTLPAGLGWPIYLSGLAGFAILMMRRFRQSAVLFAFPVAYYIVAGSGYRVFARYIIPVVPFLCIAAAWAVVAAVRAIVPVARPILVDAAVGIAAIAMVIVPARNVVLMDRLFSRPDNRLVTVRALPTFIPSGSSLYHSGGSYGRLPFELAGADFAIAESTYDDAAGQFSDGKLPDWIVLQRSPLVLYSDVPQSLERLVRDRYDLVRVFNAQNPRSSPTYDQQDAFFLPLVGLDSMTRLGPNFEVYRLRNDGRPSKP